MERYKVKLKLHLYIAIACFVIFCVSWLIFIPLAWLIAIVVSLASMYLLAEIFVSLLYEDTIKIFCKAFWRIWEKDKLQFTRKIISHAAHEALKNAIEYRIRRSSMEKEIRSRIDQEIEELSFAHMLAYDDFGDSRSALTEKIYKSALNAIDYESIFERIKQITGRVMLLVLTYSIIAFLFRIGIVELSGLGWLKWTVLPIFFGLCFWWHKQRLLSPSAAR